MRRTTTLPITHILALPRAKSVSIAGTQSVPIAEPDADRLRFERQLG